MRASAYRPTRECKSAPLVPAHGAGAAPASPGRRLRFRAHRQRHAQGVLPIAFASGPVVTVTGRALSCVSTPIPPPLALGRARTSRLRISASSTRRFRQTSWLMRRRRTTRSRAHRPKTTRTRVRSRYGACPLVCESTLGTVGSRVDSEASHLPHTRGPLTLGSGIEAPSSPHRQTPRKDAEG